MKNKSDVKSTNQEWTSPHPQVKTSYHGYRWLQNKTFMKIYMAVGRVIKHAFPLEKYFLFTVFFTFSDSIFVLSIWSVSSLVFPFLEMSLKDYIKTFPDYVLPVKVASIYFRQIVNAMVNAHSLGITHNDIKAGNVLMFRDAGEDFYVAHLCDFEYARRNGHSPERRGGTEFFMPPEVCMS